MSLRKRERCPSIDAKGDHQECLNGMDDKHKPQSLFVCHSIENQHSFDSEVPGACTIGRWYDDSEVSHHERYQSTTDA